MKDKSKWVWIVLGAAVLLSGLAAWFKDVGGYILPLLLGFTGFIMLSQVSFKTLFNKKFDTSDMPDAIELVSGLAIIVTVVAVLPFVNYALPAWVITLASVSTVLAGGLIVGQGLRQ